MNENDPQIPQTRPPLFYNFIEEEGAEVRMKKTHRKRRLIDLLFSEFAVFVTPILGGLALYLVANISWKFFPAIFISLIPFGIGCMGINRLFQWRKED